MENEQKVILAPKKTTKKAVKRRSYVKKHEQRASREQQTWDNIDIHEEFNDTEGEFGPFPNIPARDGFSQRWIRVEDRDGEPDGRNISKQSNDYWRRRDPETIPTNILAPTGRVDNIGEVILASGYVLMERPMEIHDAKKRRIEGRTKAQLESVEKSLFNVHSPADQGFGVPHSVENRTVVSRGSGVLPVDD